MKTSISKLFPPKMNRVHEVYGDGALTFAAIMMAVVQGDIIWVAQPSGDLAMNPDGLSDYFSLSRLLLAQTRKQDEALAVAEESLRHGVGAIVVVETGASLSLTAGRRLQLAAEEGKSRGLCLIREGTGSNAAETRWLCRAEYCAGAGPGQTETARWTLEKNKSGPIGEWQVRWDRKARALIEVGA